MFHTRHIKLNNVNFVLILSNTLFYSTMGMKEKTTRQSSRIESVRSKGHSANRGAVSAWVVSRKIEGVGEGRDRLGKINYDKREGRVQIFVTSDHTLLCIVDPVGDRRRKEKNILHIIVF